MNGGNIYPLRPGCILFPGGGKSIKGWEEEFWASVEAGVIKRGWLRKSSN
jgi:hypothetical protein